MNITARIQKIDQKLKQRNPTREVSWPLFGGSISAAPGEEERNEPERSLTAEEEALARRKHKQIVITLALSREAEYLEYLNS